MVDKSGFKGGFSVVISFAWAMFAVTLISIPVLRETSRKRRAHLPLELRSRRLGLGRIWKRRPDKKFGDEGDSTKK